MYKCFVSPNGNDSNNGSGETPFATLEKAVLACSESIENEKNIVLEKGYYYDNGIILDESDSNLTIEGHGSETVVYGGKVAVNWIKEEDFYYTEIQEDKNGTTDFRMIEVDGMFRERSRLPESGAFTHRNEFNVAWMSTAAGGWARKPTEEELLNLKYIENDLGEWLDINNAEVTIHHEWDESLVKIASIDKSSKTLRLATTPAYPAGAFAERNKNAQTYILWNVREGMTKPGQWYLDRSRKRLYYKPFPNEDINKLNLIFPSKERIFTMKPGVKNITLKNLTFASAGAKFSAGGFGAHSVDGAIVAENVENISFININVTNVSGWGIKVSGKNITIANCNVHNTGAGGVSYGGENITLTENAIHDVGLIYKSSVCINGGGKHNSITKNKIYNAPYSGICGIGSDSQVCENVIFDIMGFMQDGGAIYCGSTQNTLLSQNTVINFFPEKVVNAYYFDELCENCIADNNVAINSKRPVLAHMTTSCEYTNNTFIDKGTQHIHAANSSDMIFDNNNLIAEKIVIESPKGNPQGLDPGNISEIMNHYNNATGIISIKGNRADAKSGEIIFKELFQYSCIREEKIRI